MIIKYVGKKQVLSVKAPYLSKEYSFEKDTALDVEYDDGVLLLDLFPAIFTKDGGQVATIPEAVSEGARDDSFDSEADEGGEGGEGGEDDGIEGSGPDDFTFGLEHDGSAYLCPLCDKTYKVNKGRGKAALVSHLESVHAEEWAKMLQSPEEE